MSRQQPDRDQEKDDDNLCQPPTHRDNCGPTSELAGTRIYKGKGDLAAMLEAIEALEAKRKGQRHD